MNSDILNILTEIFEVCIIPLLGILVSYLVKYINIKSEEIAEQTNSTLSEKYVKMLGDTITQCVIATNQTYVDSLKKQGKFDKQAQVTAYEKTSTAVLAILNEEAKKYLSEVYGDLNMYIEQQIEQTVNSNKIEVNN